MSLSLSVYKRKDILIARTGKGYDLRVKRNPLKRRERAMVHKCEYLLYCGERQRNIKCPRRELREREICIDCRNKDDHVDTENGDDGEGDEGDEGDGEDGDDGDDGVDGDGDDGDDSQEL